MKIPLFLILAATITFVSCSSSSYPGSSKYPDQGSTQYPYPDPYPYPGTNQYPYPGTNQYPRPTYPSNGGRNNDLIVTRDGKVIDRNGRIVGTARNVPSTQGKSVYGSRNDRRYQEDQRRRDEHHDNKRYDNDRYKKGYDKGSDKGKSDDKEKWKNKRSDRDDH